MKKAYVFILGLTLVIVSAFGNDDFRTFTSTDGREMVAALQRVSADEVTIKRKADGRQFSLDITKFSPTDQDFIRSWDETNRLSSRDALEINIRRVTGNRSKSSTSSTKKKSWEEGYEISVTNGTRADVSNLKVEYIIFMFDEAVGATKNYKGQLKKNNGSYTIDSLSPNKKTIHETQKFRMSSSQLKAGWYYTNGGKDRSKDELAGCWVRIYKNGRMLKEQALPTAVMRTEKWK